MHAVLAPIWAKNDLIFIARFLSFIVKRTTMALPKLNFGRPTNSQQIFFAAVHMVLPFLLWSMKDGHQIYGEEYFLSLPSTKLAWKRPHHARGEPGARITACWKICPEHCTSRRNRSKNQQLVVISTSLVADIIAEILFWLKFQRFSRTVKFRSQATHFFTVSHVVLIKLWRHSKPPPVRCTAKFGGIMCLSYLWQKFIELQGKKEWNLELLFSLVRKQSYESFQKTAPSFA